MGNLWTEDVSVEKLRQVFLDNGCHRVFVKALAPNDNSKNQIFVGNDLSEVSSLPSGEVHVVAGKSGKRDLTGSIVHAKLRVHWLTRDGAVEAPFAQLIFYPQYPEVRMSGFLRGTTGTPKELLDPMKRGRELGRLMLLGINDTTKTIYMAVISAQASAHAALRASVDATKTGVFSIWNLRGSVGGDSRQTLLEELCRIHSLNWIDSKRITSNGIVPYLAQNGGGYTLEAELGISPNGYAAPDFLGWEVKQHAVGNFARPRSGNVTLLTPEPDGGVYVDDGLETFMKTWGKVNPVTARIDFAGRHVFGQRQKSTGLEIKVDGFTSGAKTFDVTGGIELVDSNGSLAARWSFQKLLDHWKRKHSNAVYVPSITRWKPDQIPEVKQYMYGIEVHLGMDTTFVMFLEAFVAGVVVYDPGIHFTDGASSKRRNQLRVNSKKLDLLYERFLKVRVCP